MPDSGSAPPSGREGLSVCIIACKDLSLNTRVVRQAKSLVRAGHSVTIVGFQTPDPRLVEDQRNITLLATGAPVSPPMLLTQLWLTRYRPGGRRGLDRAADGAVAAGRSRNFLFARRALNELAGRSFDVVQAHFDKALIAASAVSREYGAKLVFDAVEVPFDEEMIPRPPVLRALRLAEIRQETEIALTADGWITVNDALAEAAERRYQIPRPLVLRNCHEAGQWQSDGRLRRDLGLSDNDRVLLHLNTMRRGEGLDVLIDALAQLPANVHLVGLGPVPQIGFRETMRRQAAQRGVADRFHLAPMQPPHALLPYIAGADIGVIARQPSLQNFRMSLPNRLFQLIAAGLPVIATPLPEIARIVREWNVGLLFAGDDPAGLAAAVRTMLESSARARYREAAEIAAGQLTWERESVPYVRFIEAVAAGNRDLAALPTDSQLERISEP